MRKVYANRVISGQQGGFTYQIPCGYKGELLRVKDGKCLVNVENFPRPLWLSPEDLLMDKEAQSFYDRISAQK